jgi:aminotransferase EvaB
MSNLIPINAIGRETQEIRSELLETYTSFLDSGWYVLGEQCKSFELELASYCGVNGAVSVGNGSDALRIAMSALGISRGALVAMTPNAGGYAALAAQSLGALPAWFDSGLNGQASVASFEELISETARLGARIEMVVVTHLFGAMAPIEELTRVARANGIWVIEDCAQAIGVRDEGHFAGSFGDLATFSFYPTKNLGALGDGGAILGNDEAILKKVRQLRQYGWGQKYEIDLENGQNSRLDELQAGVLRVKLRLLDSWNARRANIYSRYLKVPLKDCEFLNPVSEKYNGHLAVIKTRPELRSEMRSRLKALSIQTDIHYPVPDHQQPVFSGVVSPLVSLKNSEDLSKSIFTVPLFPLLHENEVERICQGLALL